MAVDTPIQDAPLPPDVRLGADQEWRAEPDPRWELLAAPDEVRRCRYGRPSCKAASVARLNRGRVGATEWWHYCADHLYGRWILNGRLVQWVVRRVGA
jgi:hypothetical protein